jgi:Sec-independent protein translocase protein TatA
MGEVIIVSLVGMVLFGGLFLLMCPEWWSNSLGTIKEKQKGAEAQAPEADKQATAHQAERR